MRVFFEHIEGSRKGQVETFDADRIRIGRKADNDLRFDPERDRDVSGYHAEVYQEGRAFFIRDLRSTNGTYVNSRRIDQPIPIADGDTIQLSSRGPKFKLLLRSPQQSDATVFLPAGALPEVPTPAVDIPAAVVPAVGLPDKLTPVSAPSSMPEARSRRVRAALIVIAAVAAIALTVALAGVAWWLWSGTWSGWAFFTGLVVAVMGLVSVVVVRWVRARRASRKLADVEQAVPAAGARDARANTLKEKWAEGLATLQRSAPGQRGEGSVYAVPWFVFLGERGAGKSETLRTARPLVSRSGRARDVADREQTLEWWLFDHAVVLETPARYSFPEDEKADAAEWLQFLALLRRTRRREPVNGVLIALPADRLLSRSPDTLREQTEHLRRRLDEMVRHLGASFPIYLVVTHTDCVAGFIEFVSRFPEAARAQAFGLLNHDVENRAGATAFVERTFQTMGDRLHQVRLALMDSAEQPGSELMRELYLFPEEFRGLRAPITAVVDALCRTNPYQEVTLLRGLFFVSASQDRIPLSPLAERMGFRHLPPERATHRQPFFVGDLLAAVLPQERPLARRTLQWHEHLRLGQLVALSAVAGIALIACGLFTLSFIANRHLLWSVDPGACGAQGAGPSGLARPLERLDACRESIARLSPGGFWTVAALDFGLRHTAAVEERLRELYLVAFRSEVLEPVEAALDAKLATPREAPLYIGTLQRAALLTECLAQQCLGDDDRLRAGHRVMLSALYPEIQSGDPRVGQLVRTQLAYLAWHPGDQALPDMRRRDLDRVTQWTAAGGLRPDLILASTAARFPPVRMRDFWAGDASDAQVDPAFTHRGWKEGIQPLIAGLRPLAGDRPEIKEALDRFDLHYRGEAFRQWGQFLAGFSRGERGDVQRSGRRDSVARTLSPDSSYRRVIDAAALHLGVLDDRPDQTRDVPSWYQTLRRYVTLRSKLEEAQKAAGKEKPDDARGKLRDDEREAAAYLGRYLDALAQLRGELGSLERSFRSTQKALEEPPASDRSNHPMQKALWNLEGLKAAIGAPRGEDFIVWNLLTRPVHAAWHLMLDESGQHLQQQWEALRADMTELLPSQKVARVMAFVNGPAGLFLERRGERWVPRSLLNESVSFAPAFLDYLARSRRSTPDAGGEAEPPQFMVTAR